MWLEQSVEEHQFTVVFKDTVQDIRAVWLECGLCSVKLACTHSQTPQDTKYGLVWPGRGWHRQSLLQRSHDLVTGCRGHMQTWNLSKSLNRQGFLGENSTQKTVNYDKCQIATKQRKIVNGNLTLGKLTWVYLPWMNFPMYFTQVGFPE